MARLLIIEDDSDIRSWMSSVLEDDGHKVVDAENGLVAMRLLDPTRIDLVVTDIFMPEQEGIETIGAIRHMSRTVPILAMSGSPVAAYLSAAVKLGADAMLPKPFSAERLIEAIDQLLAYSTSATAAE